MRAEGWLPALSIAVLLAGAPGAGAATAPKAPAAAPDSIIARAGGHAISLGELEQTWRRANPGASVDSLTPEARREFLQLLVEKALLSQAALKANPPLNPLQQADLRALEDNLTQRTLLDSLLVPYREEVRRAWALDRNADTSFSAVNLEASKRLRDSTLARARIRYDDATIAAILPAWKALPERNPSAPISEQLKTMAEMPKVAPSDTARRLAVAGTDTAWVSDLLRGWKQTSPFNRPRIETGDQLRDLTGNVVFGRWLRRKAQALQLNRRPRIRMALDERREYYVVTQYVDGDVWTKIPQDSVTLRRQYAREPDYWTVPACVQTLRLSASNGTEAESLARILREPARAESLLAQSKRSRLNLTWLVSIREDSLRYEQLRAAGVGAVVGPLVVDSALVVARVLALVPPRPRGFDEVRTLVLKKWMDQEGERRMRALLDDLRRRNPPRIRQEYR